MQQLISHAAAIGMLLWIVVAAGSHLAVAQECTTTVAVNALTYDTHQPLSFQPERLHASFGSSTIVFSRVEKVQSNRILILVDISASMESKLPFAKIAFQLLLQNLPPGSSLTYGFFNQEYHLAGEFTRNEEEFAKAVQVLEGYKPKGHTALRDAVHEGLKLFQRPAPGDSILLITDAWDNQSKIRDSALEREIRESGVRVFAIVPLFPIESSFTPIGEESGPLWLEDVANKTGGRIFTIYHDWPHMEKKWLQLTAALLENFWREGVGGGYLLSLQLPVSLTKPIKWKLRLDTSGDKRLKEASLIYPEKLAPCSLPVAGVH